MVNRILAGLAIVAGAALATPHCGAQTAVRAQVRSYAAAEGFRNVANFRAFDKTAHLTAGQKEMLRSNLFVCYPRDDKQLYWVYGRNDYANIPSIVTTDSVLQLHHVFYDSVLRISEEGPLSTLVGRMTNTLLADALAVWRASSDPAIKSAALKNVAYLGVAARALGGKPALPPAASEMVDREMERIQASQGYTVSAIFPYKLDYSQFIVRGHYTKSAALQRYFRAMMWYGLAPMAVRYENDGHWVRADEQIRQSLLLTRSLYQTGTIQTWDRI